MVRQGRGAWPRDGQGGTLDAAGAAPGKYYSLAQEPLKQIGLKTLCRKLQGESVAVDYDATYHGVLAIQALLIEDFNANLNGDGVYGPSTRDSVVEAQKSFGVTADGVVGPETMRWLLWPHIHQIANYRNVPWNIIYGLLQNEGAWDPGAVGWVDGNDLGLAQINLTYHPDVTLSEAFCSSFAINFIANYMATALQAFDNNVIDATVSYNLGIGGARQWIRDGRPIQWTPPWSPLERRPFEYADRILNAAYKHSS